MARILYTVCGIGLGHATRSALIINELIKDHDIFIASYGPAYTYLAERFSSSAKLKWFELVFEKNKYNKAQTFLFNLPLFPYIAASNFLNLIKLIHKFKPEIIVSDFDVNGVYIAQLFGLPVLTISNMHLMKHIEPELKLNEKINYYLTEKPILDSFIGSDYYLITSFVKPKKKADNVFFFNPLVRKELLDKQPKEKNFFLVYTHENNIPSLLPVLEALPEYSFVVYGLNKSKREKNIEFKKYNSKQFSEDLLNCKAVLCHGGFSVICEAVVLGKPVYVFTSKDFFERYFNGLLVKGFGFGELYEAPAKESIFYFAEHLRNYREKIVERNVSPDRGELAKKINALIEFELKKKRGFLKVNVRAMIGLLKKKFREEASKFEPIKLIKDFS